MQEITFKHKNVKAASILTLIGAIVFLFISLILAMNAYSTNKKTLDDTLMFSGTLESIEEKGSMDSPYYIFKLKDNVFVFKISNLNNKLQNNQNLFKDSVIGSDLEFRVLKSQLSSSELNIISLSVSGKEFFSFEEGRNILSKNSLIGVAVTGTLGVICLVAMILLRKYNKKIPKTVTLTQSFILQSQLGNRINNSYHKKIIIVTSFYLVLMIVSLIMFFLGVEVFTKHSFTLLLIIGGLSMFIVATFVAVIISLKYQKKLISFFCDLYKFKELDDYHIKENRYYDLVTTTVLKFDEDGLKISLPKQEDSLKFIEFATGKPPTAKFLKKMKLNSPEIFNELEIEIFLPYSELELLAQATYKNFGDYFTLCLVIQPKNTPENLDKLIQLFYVFDNEDDMNTIKKELAGEELPFFLTFIDENLYNIIKKLNLNVSFLDEILMNRETLIKTNIRKQPIFTKLGKVIER